MLLTSFTYPAGQDCTKPSSLHWEPVSSPVELPEEPKDIPEHPPPPRAQTAASFAKLSKEDIGFSSIGVCGVSVYVFTRSEPE
ncbi:MAG: hypothetical protein J6I65_06205 [Lachnospiraceae bacterium]|nr:hypothetical protein [Lachnospiraceae bacterium]